MALATLACAVVPARVGLRGGAGGVGALLHRVGGRRGQSGAVDTVDVDWADWFASNPPPRLPTVMMIGAELNTPADWLRAGAAVSTAHAFAAAHGGYAPVLVFVDPTGAFRNDTASVNGRRGNAADHLTNDVVPFVTSNFGVSRDPANWGIVGWSLTVKFSAQRSSAVSPHPFADANRIVPRLI